LVQRGIDWLDEHDTRRADRMLVRQIVKDAFVFIEAGDHDKARFLASKAKEFNIRFRPGERTPDDVLAVLDIMRALKRSMAEPVKVQSAPEPAKSDAFERLIRKAIEWFDGPTWQPEAGLTLPSPHYLRHPPQYFPPSMPSPLPKELRALEEAAKQRDVTPHRVFDYGVPRELQIPDGERRQDLYAQPFPRAKQAAIEKRLREPISLNFKNVPLRDVVKDLTAASGVPVLLDMRALRRNNIDLDATVSVEVDDVSMNTALDLLFGPLDLGHVIQDDVIIISPNTQ
ncbi:MAG: hypothetical protein HY289_07380, partial [Planctomycetes bacterium]|nr:hypothetical protein [Planctomycetota bacterium]